MVGKKNAFRTFIVVRNNNEQTDANEKDKSDKDQKTEVNIGQQDETKHKGDSESKSNIKKKDKKSPSPTNDKTKPGILKSPKKPSEEHENSPQTPKTHHKGYLAKSPNKSISFDKSPDTDHPAKKQVYDKRVGTFNRNEAYIDSFYQRSKPSDDNFKPYDDSFKYNFNDDYDFPSFSGEIFIGRPIYSIRGNFKKKKNLVGSGRIAPVMGTKASPCNYNRALEQGAGTYESGGVSSNMVYTNSNMGEHFNKKYKPDYRNKVVIEVNNNQNDNKDSTDNADVSRDHMSQNYSHNNSGKFNKTWGNDGCYRNYYQNHQHGYTGWGKYRGGRMNGGRGWMRGDTRYIPDAQDVRLIVMCGDNDSNEGSLKGENEEVSRITSNNVSLQNDNISRNNQSIDGNKKEGRRFKGEYNKEG